MDMDSQAYREPFDAVGITPPRGRQGHSVPTPRPLNGAGVQEQAVPKPPHPCGKVSHQAPVAMTTTKHSPSPAQFYSRREHTSGGSLSKLDRLASRTELAYLESFSEADEDDPDVKEEDNEVFDGDEMDSGRPISRQSRTSNDLGASRTSRSRVTLDQFTGDSMLHYSYSAGAGLVGMPQDSLLGGSFVRAFTQGLNSSLNVPFLGQSSPNANTNSTLFPSAARNPNKAIITIDAQSSMILTANEMTCELFGYQRNELVNIKVQNLFTEPYRAEHRALVEPNIDSTGKTVLVSGKVMDAVTSYGVEFPVSVWMKRVGVSPSPSTDIPGPLVSRVILIIEPVERSSAFFTIEKNGKLISFDPWFACLFGYTELSEMVGRNVTEFIPSLKLPTVPEELSQLSWKQAITGRSKDGTVFPLTVKFTDVSQNLSIGDMYSPTDTASSHPLDEVIETMSTLSPTTRPVGELSAVSMVTMSDGPSPTHTTQQQDSEQTPLHKGDRSPDNFTLNAKVVVYAALSGMISFLPDGSIHGCNHQFTSMLFGYSQEELLKKDITFLVPDFYSHINYIDEGGMPLPPLDEDQEDLFHSAVERSLSPERAYELVQQADLSRNESIVSLTHKRGGEHVRSPARRALNLQHIQSPTPTKPSPRKQVSPVSLADELASTEGVHQMEVVTITDIPRDQEMAASSSAEVLTSSSSDLINNPRTDSSHAGSTSPNPDPVPSTGHIQTLPPVPNRLVPSQSTGHIQTLPPVPNRLVPSQSTERIFEILKQHDLEKGEPLSSTPAGKTARTNVAGDQVAFTLGLRRESYESIQSVSSLPEGTYLGEARHKDGSMLAIVFQLKCITLADDQKVFCVWISRDLDRDRARTADFSMSMSRPPPDPYRSDQLISPDVVPQPEAETTDHTHKPHPSQFNEEALAMDGEYMLSYDTLKPIGKGAFGFVRLAHRKEDGLMVVVKFLRKSSVLKDCWMDDEEMGRVPLEISLLARLSHPNVVQLLEAYENEFFFQMVMEKHGDGLDLFEFIEMGPRLEEPLTSFMFRQIVAGLSYLHERSILHRDIKDENIIIDQLFQLKLIDFGSAAYMAPGKLFNTFCGTLEYCSPEVLLGNSYAGPELEMWALGVTLYTLVFGENPFFDIEETISGHLQPPFLTSPALMKVLFWLLHPDPKSRATLKDLQKDKWTNQDVDSTAYNFETVLGFSGSVNLKPPKNGIVDDPPVHLGKSNSESDALNLHSALEQQLQMADR